MFDHMRFPRWHLQTIDKRGSLNLPAELKSFYGFGPGTMLLLRPLGDCLFFIPRGRIHGEHTKEHGLDLEATTYANTFWSARSPLEPEVVLQPPLFDAAASAPALPASPWSPTPAPLRKIVAVNGKGFIPIPDEIKEALGLRREDNVLVELRVNEAGVRILVMEPLEQRGPVWAKYLEERRQAHLEEEKREQRKARLVDEITTLGIQKRVLESKIEDLEKMKTRLIRDVKDANSDLSRAALLTPFQRHQAIPDVPLGEFPAPPSSRPPAAVPASEELLSLQAMPREQREPSWPLKVREAPALDGSHLPDCFPGKIKAPTVRTTVHAPGHPLHEFEVEDNAMSEQICRELFSGATMHVPVPGIPMLVPPDSPTHAPVSTEPVLGPDGKPIPESTAAPVVQMDPNVLQPGNVWRQDPFFGRIQVPDDRDTE